MSGYPLESMIGAFTGSLNFRWTAGPARPAIVANKIERLGKDLDDMLFPMVAARQIVMDDIEDRFAREVDLDGQPWKEHSPKYKENRRGSQKLRKDDDLYDAVTSPTSYPIVGNSLHVDTSGWPVYWRIHNQGGQAGKGASIPKRSYLGASEAAGFAIIDVFDDWVAGQLRINIGITGVAQAFEGTRFGRRIGMHRQRSSMASAPGFSWSMPELEQTRFVEE